MAPPRRKTGSNPLVKVLAWLSFGILIWTAGLIWFVETLPSAVKDAEAKTDAIVVLTGGRGRLEEGLDLLDRGLGRKLFVSGVFPGMDVRRLLNIFRQGDQILENRVSIGTAPDTITNASETAQWMASQNYGSLRLVTSAYHLPRALLEFQAQLGDRQIIAHPVFADHIKQDDWWAWPGTTNLMIEEYNKFLLAWLRLEIQSIAAKAAH